MLEKLESLTKPDFEKDLKNIARKIRMKNLEDLSKREWKLVLCEELKELLPDQTSILKEKFSSEKCVIYMSMEFLTGRYLVDTLYNVKLYNVVKEILKKYNAGDVNSLEETDPSLGNGGLGRLAACYAESMATLKLNGFGFGILFKYGLFKQGIKNHKQTESPDGWNKEGWVQDLKNNLYPDVPTKFDVWFKNEAIRGVLNIAPTVGYEGNTSPLSLWDVEKILGQNSEIASKIADTLYPDDSTDGGKQLRIMQEYFMCSCTMQLAFAMQYHKFHTVDNIADYYQVQLNDTHPTLAIVEFIRLYKEYGHTFDEGLAQAKRVFNYTNHTILPEALEKWDEGLFKRTLRPEIFQIIEDMNLALINEIKDRPEFCQNGNTDWNKVGKYELFKNGVIKMANIATFVSQNINGVAKIHSKILTESTLKDWYLLYPEKFTNVTNGITPRRWVLHSNPLLAKLLTEVLGEEWVTDFKKFELLKDPKFTNDLKFLQRLFDIKHENKKELAKYIKEWTNVDVNPDSMYFVQVKRIHEYKRQLMTALAVIVLYKEMLRGTFKTEKPMTFIIAGKAAPSYVVAKRIISLLTRIQDTINSDTRTNSMLKLVFIPDYDVSKCQKIIPASDFSLQVSLAGTEASGTGNMKQSINGALTIGTLDGANVEIVEKSGKYSNYIFGLKADQVEKLKQHYYPNNWFNNDSAIRDAMSMLVDGTLGEKFEDLYNLTLTKDPFMVLADLNAYLVALKKAVKDYNQDKVAFEKKMLMNIAGAGFFSSDRSIAEYATKIWHIA